MSVLSTFTHAAVTVGLLAIVYGVYRILSFVSFHWYVPGSPLARYRHARDGPNYALITGSSAGIGLGFAHHLLKLGFGVILLAHKQDELEEARTQLHAATSSAANIKLLCLDAMTVKPADLETALASVSKLPISILVNNIGSLPVNPPHFRHLWEYSAEELDNTISLNNRFMVQITRIMMPVLTANKRPSLIVNLSSGGRIGLPWLAIYCATKAFCSSFSRSIDRDAKAAGYAVDSIAIIPGDVHSQGNSEALHWGAPMAIDFAGMAVNRIDTAVSRGMLEIFPFWLHELEMAVLELLPESIKQKALSEGMAAKRDAYNKVK
jgi:17beta-estradiol 17-dehydrogenase / very-long-chain 3-oxoacyl-CoA reductase